MKVYLLLLIMTFLGAIASLFLKRASDAKEYLSMLKNINIYVGAGLYMISAILNIYVLRFLEYSVILPLTSLTYIWTMILAHLILKERITGRKIVGVILILIGAICISL